MNVKIRKLLAVLVGVLCSLTAMFALAGEWSGRTLINKIIVQADQTVLVFNKSGTWKNPDLCDSDKKIVRSNGCPPRRRKGRHRIRTAYTKELCVCAFTMSYKPLQKRALLIKGVRVLHRGPSRWLTDSMASRTVAGGFCWPGGFNIPYLNQCLMELPIYCAK